jgi:RNA polymerase sigma-70 factor, ECF subfamily
MNPDEYAAEPRPPGPATFEDPAVCDVERTAWLMRYEPWLKLLARLEMDSRFQSKFSTSDAVQQTLLEAWQGWARFRGTSEAQRMAWVRQILAHQLARLGRQYAGTQKRAIGREVSFEQSLDAMSQKLAALLPDKGDSPSAPVLREEQQTLVAQLLERLPHDYREVLILRNLENLPHEEVARRMGRSVGAVRMLWIRALAQLRQELLLDTCPAALQNHRPTSSSAFPGDAPDGHPQAD